MGVFTSEYRELSLQEYERKTRTWEYKVCILPIKCIETGKWMWLKGAYRGYKTRRIEDNVFLNNYKWMCKEEFVKLRLMGEV
jgi:hypothetical protein